MSDARQNQLLDILKHCLKRLALGRGLRRQRGANLSRLRLRQHRKRLNPLKVIGKPVHYFMATPPELFWSHMKIVVRWHSTSLLIGLIIRAVMNHILWRLDRISKPPKQLVDADYSQADPRSGQTKGKHLSARLKCPSQNRFANGVFPQRVKS